jgi:hypothetical protein
MRNKPKTAREFMTRYPHITAHIVSESLGYATPTTAARIGLDGLYGRKNYCEWVASCYGGEAKEVLERSIQHRHGHKGYMSWYRERALPLVKYAIEHEEEPLFASWF